MDREVMRTFLQIAQSGTLVKAAERLHVTQATVSARLLGLEAELNARLFVRNKAGTRLTEAGRALVPYANELTAIWEKASLAVAQSPKPGLSLSLGGEFSLCSAVLLNWLVALRTTLPKVSVRCHVDSANHLLDKVRDGTLDIAVLYSPLRLKGVSTSLVFEEELVAVTTDGRGGTIGGDDYVYVDWGPDFETAHERAFPELRTKSRAIGLGPLALRYLLKVGGTGYFRTRAIEPYIRSQQLYRIANAPNFSYSLYAAYSGAGDPHLLSCAKEQLAISAMAPVEGWI